MTALPLTPPKVIDQQRTRVCRAIAGVDSAVVPVDRVRDLVAAAMLEHEGDRLEVVEGDELGYWPPDTLAVAGEPTEVQVLHHVAHHLTPSVFPAHGAEFVSIFLELVDTVAPHLSQKLRWSLAREDVNGVPDGSAAAAKLEKWGRRHPGALVKLVLADPPDRVVGLLADVGEAATLRTARGEERVPLDRVRYCSRKT